VSKTLQSHGYSTVYASLASTGHASPGNPTLLDNIQHICRVIQSLVEEGKEVVLVGYSAGGGLGAAAIKDLSLKKMREDKKKGGVMKLVFLTSGIASEGGDILIFYRFMISRYFFTLIITLP